LNPIALFHLLADYVRAVSYAGGRLFSAGDDKTVSVFYFSAFCLLPFPLKLWLL
jgi:hypothetical protein